MLITKQVVRHVVKVVSSRIKSPVLQVHILLFINLCIDIIFIECTLAQLRTL